MNRIGVFGLWHLGSVTAACLARKGFQVTGFDPDPALVENLRNGKAPLYEPGLDALLREQIQSKRLGFTDSIPAATAESDLIWVAWDTPVDDQDQADILWVRGMIERLLPHLRPNQAMILSSQVPVGFCRELEILIHERRPDLDIPVAYSPENLRLGNALQAFDHPDRIVIGIRRNEDRPPFEPILKSLSEKVLWMKTESAEMTKHALNSFLAVSVAFANELAVLSEAVGADARDVEKALKSDARIGPRAYLKPGAAFAGGTLARDVQFLTALSRKHRQPAYLLQAVLESNEKHKLWVRSQLQTRLEPLRGKRVAILGLAYKAGTDALRRSWTIELSRWLHAEGAAVQAFDWQLEKLPEDLTSVITLKADIASALEGCDALVIGNDHPGLKDIAGTDLKRMKQPVIVDPNGSLSSALIDSIAPLDYFSVGFRSDRKAETHEPARKS